MASILCLSGLSGSLPHPHRSVQLATLVTTVRMTWTSVPPSPASMGASALTLWPAISARVLQERWVGQCQGWGTGREAGFLTAPDCSPSPLPLGVLCEINEDDCGPGPPLDPGPRCLHNGTCVDLVGGFRCTCPPGYTGLRCEADINECRPGACHAAHTRDCLQDPGGGFHCLCHAGFTGKHGRGGWPAILPVFPIVADPRASACPGPHCQTVLSPCESQPCQHGGQCHPSPGAGGALTFSCHCVPVGGVDTHINVSGRGVGSCPHGRVWL